MIGQLIESGKKSFSSVAGAFSKGGFFAGLQALSDVFKPDKPANLFSAFDIGEFRASFNQGEEESTSIARNNTFQVLVMPPLIEDKKLIDDSQRGFAFRIEAVELPGRALATTDVRTFGPIRKVPYGTPMYNEITLVVITNEALYERKVFHAWMDYIQKSTQREPGFTLHHSGDINYYENLIGTVEIRVFDSLGGRPRARVTLHEAYPISIEPVPLSWSDNGTYMKHMVRICYHSYSEYYEEKRQKEEEAGGFLNQLKRFKNDVKGMITDIKNFKNTIRNQKESWKSIKKNLERQWRDGDTLDRISTLADAPDMIASGLGDSAFKLLDRSNRGSITNMGERAWNFSKSFF